VNKFGNAKVLFDTLKVENDKEKSSSYVKLNDYVNPVLGDLDPDQGIEDEYKRNHDQTFSWRFLRQASYVDHSVFMAIKKVD
jgi:hypothetical protein